MDFNVFDANNFLHTAGYIGLFVVLFAETGLLIGLILPGESLLLTAAFLSSLHYLNLLWVILVSFMAAGLADSLAYSLGKKYGDKIFNRPDSFFFSQKQLARARNFYERHGQWAIVVSRFVPFVRTVAPILAGVGRMRYPLFLISNLTGAALWSIVISLIGYYLPQVIPSINHHVSSAILLIAFLCLVPVVLSFVFEKDKHLLK